ncbi:hypothetical protein Hanom_Chr07g00588951 [Helianthus anomalus]
MQSNCNQGNFGRAPFNPIKLCLLVKHRLYIGRSLHQNQARESRNAH